MECKDCVRGFISGCAYSYHSAACLTTAKPWREEPKDKLLKYLDNLKSWYEQEYKTRMAKIAYIKTQIEEECTNG